MTKEEAEWVEYFKRELELIRKLLLELIKLQKEK
jgi:hypothetical protein